MAQHPKKVDQMLRRRTQGLTHRELGEEFGMSHTHAGRLLRANKEKGE